MKFGTLLRQVAVSFYVTLVKNEKRVKEHTLPWASTMGPMGTAKKCVQKLAVDYVDISKWVKMLLDMNL